MQVATYSPIEGQEIKVGHRAKVYCLEHTRRELCHRTVYTSRVNEITEDGFKTLNTYYKRDKNHDSTKT